MSKPIEIKYNKEVIKRLHVEGRRWFDRTYGNTYCASKVYVNGKHILTTDWTYGYDDFYVQHAGEQLDKTGTLTLTKYKGELRPPLWVWCRENGIEFSCSAADGLKRDMVAFSKELPRKEGN